MEEMDLHPKHVHTDARQCRTGIFFTDSPEALNALNPIKP